MRPTLLAISAVLAIATTVAVAGADNAAKPTFQYDGKGNVTVLPSAGTHINREFPWSIKDASGNNTVKAKGAFNFVGGSAPNEADSVTVALAAGTMKGGYCGGGNCYTFTAICTTSSCTPN
jgi:hypothetical protein